MSDDKDRLAEHLRQKEHAEENHYFAEQSRKQLEKLRAAHAPGSAAGEEPTAPAAAPGSK